MPFTVIAGRFVPGLGTPDGDSLRFVPQTPDPLFGLRRQGTGPRINAQNGSVQLRFEAIDTMEARVTHPGSAAARAANLAFLGVADAAEAPGYICATQLDPNGRPICFVFPGAAPVAHGGTLFLGPDDLQGSVNLHQLTLGLAYPLFYDTLFDDLRRRCAAEVAAARAAGRGLWPDDRTTTGADWTGSAATLPPIYPKLWRRVEEYIRTENLAASATPFLGLPDWIAQAKPERVIITSQDKITGFDNIVDTDGVRLRLIHDPTEVVVVS